eukprot:INCI3755.2.p1 GENE.INCI3755.2~~INCI3755.2.p1  ORF type:complete len:404 (+),score=47.83 INCI3755.2:125-1336(+)
MAHRPALQRVVVTGMGLVSPLGNGAARTWANLLAGRSGAASLGPDFEDLPVTIGACVPRGTEEGQIDMDKYKSRAQSVNFIAYALEAAAEALQDAKWSPSTEEEQCETGVAIGSGVGNIADTVAAAEVISKPRGFRRISPYFVPRILVNLAGGHVSIEHGLKGPNHACSTACATGAHAIGDAFRMIERGDANVMVCGGTESSMDRLSVAGFAKAQALCTTSNDNPEGASRPFDAQRSGFVIGEGAGVAVLESLDHALARGLGPDDIYAEICGYGLTGDAFHITAPREDGDGAARCMLAALRSAGLTAQDIDYVNAHATSTKLGDTIEIAALDRVFADARSEPVAVSSTKGHIGHLLGAAGAVEALLSVKALKEGILLPTFNLEDPVTTGPNVRLVQKLEETGA